MKKLTLWGGLLIVFLIKGYGSESLVQKIKFAPLYKAKELLSQEDAFTKSWSQFDLDSRLNKQQSTQEELFAFITKQAREWTSQEKNKIRSICDSIDKQIREQGFKMDFPQEIYFVKTTAKEEGGAAGYTRANYIVLKEDMLTRSTLTLKELIIHELFHILTRANPDFRKEMYALIGFRMINHVDYPEHLKAYRITNPDAPQTDSYITLSVDGKPFDGMMILYATEAYSGGSFFKYLNVGFLSVTGDTVKSIELADHKPVIYKLKQVSGFFEQVGNNTQYIILPEEILADNFVLTLLNKTGLPNQDLIDKIKRKLRE